MNPFSAFQGILLQRLTEVNDQPKIIKYPILKINQAALRKNHHLLPQGPFFCSKLCMSVHLSSPPPSSQPSRWRSCRRGARSRWGRSGAPQSTGCGWCPSGPAAPSAPRGCRGPPPAPGSSAGRRTVLGGPCRPGNQPRSIGGDAQRILRMEEKGQGHQNSGGRREVMEEVGKLAKNLGCD